MKNVRFAVFHQEEFFYIVFCNSDNYLFSLYQRNNCHTCSWYLSIRFLVQGESYAEQSFGMWVSQVRLALNTKHNIWLSIFFQVWCKCLKETVWNTILMQKNGLARLDSLFVIRLKQENVMGQIAFVIIISK